MNVPNPSKAKAEVAKPLKKDSKQVVDESLALMSKYIHFSQQLGRKVEEEVDRDAIHQFIRKLQAEPSSFSSPEKHSQAQPLLPKTGGAPPKQADSPQEKEGEAGEEHIQNEQIEFLLSMIY
mmetsp:Transcript_12904/g.21826  ORF Transcript_12904/g.21826 Transcript_12904/m.21826 type:complete len:122 (+) Transcript_12904:505-870(+)